MISLHQFVMLTCIYSVDPGSGRPQILIFGMAEVCALPSALLVLFVFVSETFNMKFNAPLKEIGKTSYFL